MTNKSHTTRDSTYIALGIATLIGGGFVIFQISFIFPIPGMKYILMAPYLSMVMYVLLSVVEGRHALIKISTVFAGIMGFMNLFMGLAIVLTGVLSQLSMTPFKSGPGRNQYGASLYAGYTGLTALLIPKYMMGGLFELIPFKWMFITSLLCLCFGFLGTFVAKKMMSRIKNGLPSL